MSQNTVSVVNDVSLKVKVGSEAVNQVHEGVLILAQQNTTLQHRSKGLIESLQTLSEMAVVVNQVAERADLVAWNSNIVADQVQGSDDVARAISSAATGIAQLAKKCRDAVGKIESQLRIMNESARETQHAVDSSQRELTTLQDRSNKALASLGDISAMTSSLRDSADDVTKQTRVLQQQASDMENSMATVLNYSAENAAASDQTAKAVSGVNRSAQEMLRSIQKFLRGE
jgi:methyl-accepting chemotaxis protein